MHPADAAERGLAERRSSRCSRAAAGTPHADRRALRRAAARRRLLAQGPLAQARARAGQRQRPEPRRGERHGAQHRRARRSRSPSAGRDGRQSGSMSQLGSLAIASRCRRRCSGRANMLQAASANATTISPANALPTARNVDDAAERDRADGDRDAPVAQLRAPQLEILLERDPQRVPRAPAALAGPALAVLQVVALAAAAGDRDPRAPPHRPGQCRLGSHRLQCAGGSQPSSTGGFQLVPTVARALDPGPSSGWGNLQWRSFSVIP